MTFEELWREVQGLPDTAKLQVPGTRSESTKKMLSKKTPEEVSGIVLAAIEDANNGSVVPHGQRMNYNHVAGL